MCKADNGLPDNNISDFVSDKGKEHTSSVLYIAIATPLPVKSNTFKVVGGLPSVGVYTSWSLPGPGTT